MEQKDIEQIGEVINQAVEPLHEQLDKIDGRLDKIDGRLNAIENKIDNMDDRLISVESKMVTMEGKMDSMEGKMVTKSYLDDKFADFSGEVISKLRKEDAKVNRLAEILRHKEIIDDEDLKQLAELQIFSNRAL